MEMLIRELEDRAWSTVRNEEVVLHKGQFCFRELVHLRMEDSREILHVEKCSCHKPWVEPTARTLTEIDVVKIADFLEEQCFEFYPEEVTSEGISKREVLWSTIQELRR